MIKKLISDFAVFFPKLLRLLPINDVQEKLYFTEQWMLLDEFSDLRSYGSLGPMKGNRIKQSHDDEIDEEEEPSLKTILANVD